MNLIAPGVPKTGGAFKFNPQYHTAGEGSYEKGKEGVKVCQFWGVEEAGVPGENHIPAAGY